MIRVLVIPERGMSGPFNACAYIRLLLPLSKPGVTSRAIVRYAVFDDLERHDADVVITHRVSLIDVAEAEKVARYCARRGAKWIYDLDDDLLALNTDHPETENYARLKPVVLWSASHADQMWVSTIELARIYADIAVEVKIVPNTLDHRMWRPPGAIDAAGDKPVRFLYMGTSTHKYDFQQILAPSFAELAQEFAGKVQLDVLGVLDRARPSDPWSVMRAPQSYASAYPAFATWMQSLRGYSIGLAPLCDTPFNRAKSNIKWLEYSALGLATIAADLPPYGEGTRRGENILLVEPTAEAFGNAMRSLVKDCYALLRLQRNAAACASEQLEQSALQAEPRARLMEELASGRNAARDSKRMSASAINKERLSRALLAQSFLRGEGIEIGALHNPLAVPQDIRVRYVDHLDKPGLYEHYPELKQFNLVDVDIIDNGEKLEKVAQVVRHRDYW